MSEIIWIKKPTVLLDKEHIKNLWPRADMEMVEKINAITRLIIILTFLGYLVSRSVKIIITGVITLGVLVFLYYSKRKKPSLPSAEKISKEGFTNPELYKLMEGNFTKPTKENPLMNVNLTELNGNPNRKAAAPAFNPEVEKQINDKTKTQILEKNSYNEKLFKNLGENIGFEHSMRNFYATPNTQIPNDQKGFAEFCYGDMPSCKEGNEFACIKNTGRWTNY